jgi:hypothetical protein
MDVCILWATIFVCIVSLHVWTTTVVDHILKKHYGLPNVKACVQFQFGIMIYGHINGFILLIKYEYTIGNY